VNLTEDTVALIPTVPGKRYALSVSIGTAGLEGGTLTIEAAADPTDIPFGNDPITATTGFEITAPTEALRITLADAEDTVDIRILCHPILE
jgi:hypothetical protein